VAESAEFAVPENMLDTWNTIGQILVHTDGLQYEGRAQMLGLYIVRSRGERLLIRTQAVVIQAPGGHMQTRVMVIGPDGKRNRSAAAIGMLEMLKRRIPEEVARYRQPIHLPKR
jgi:hypothetical protein